MSNGPHRLLARCLLLALVCAASFAVGAGAMLLFVPPAGVDELVSGNLPRDFVVANRTLAPEDIVKLQLKSLRKFRHDETAMLQCFALASPANRSYTGPLERFTRMCQDEHYGPMIDGRKTLVGKPILHGDRAMVLVTIMDANSRTFIYRFFLSKQTEPPYAGCWMTDAVVAGGFLAPIETGPPSTDGAT
jgi:hypothetical protein